MAKALALATVAMALVGLSLAVLAARPAPVAAQRVACTISGAASLTITESGGSVSSTYSTSFSNVAQGTDPPPARLYWSGPGSGGVSSGEGTLSETITFDTAGTWQLRCREPAASSNLGTLTVTVALAPVRVPDAPGDSVVLTRDGATGQVPLCEPVTLTLSVVYQPVNTTDKLDYAIQEENGSGGVTGIIKRLTVATHTGTGVQKVTMTEEVSHCSEGPRHYRGVRQLEQVGGQESELVTVEWAGEVRLSAFETRARLNENITLRTEVYPLDWPGATVELQSRAVSAAQGQWQTARAAASYTRTERGAIAALPVTQATAGAYQYRWKLAKGDITVYSNVVLLYWATPLPTPTPFVVRDEEAERQNIVKLSKDGRYTREAPDVVTYRAKTTEDNNCLAFIEVEFLPVQHAQHYQVSLAGVQQDLVDQSGPAGFVSFCQAEGSGSGEVELIGFIRNEGPAYEIEVQDQVLVVPADATVYTAPASLQINWDISAVGNEFLGPGAGKDPDAAAVEPLEGVEELAVVIAGIFGASPSRVDVMLPMLCMILAVGGAAGVVWPLGWSPPAAAAGMIVFVLIWTVGGPAWFGVPLGMALALTLVMLVGGGTMVFQRVWG